MSKVVQYPAGFTCLDNRLLESARFRALTTTTRLVYMYLLKFRNNKDGHAFPSQGRIAELTGVSVATVKRAVAKLIEARLIQLVSFDGRRNKYAFVYDGEEAELQPDPEPEVVESVTTPVQPEVKAPAEPIELADTASCAARLRRGYHGWNLTRKAVAIWWDTYMSRNGNPPKVIDWPQNMKHGKRLAEFATREVPKTPDLDTDAHEQLIEEWLIAYVGKAFDLAKSHVYPFNQGPTGVMSVDLTNGKGATLICAALAGLFNPGQRRDIPVYSDPEDSKRPEFRIAEPAHEY